MAIFRASKLAKNEEKLWLRRAAGIIWYTKSISNSPTNIDIKKKLGTLYNTYFIYESDEVSIDYV